VSVIASRRVFRAYIVSDQLERASAVLPAFDAGGQDSQYLFCSEAFHFCEQLLKPDAKLRAVGEAMLFERIVGRPVLEVAWHIPHNRFRKPVDDRRHALYWNRRDMLSKLLKPFGLGQQVVAEDPYDTPPIAASFWTVTSAGPKVSGWPATDDFSSDKVYASKVEVPPRPVISLVVFCALATRSPKPPAKLPFRSYYWLPSRG